MRRFTRTTNAFFESHTAAIALYFMYYNFGRVHQMLRVPPAMEAGVSSHGLVHRGDYFSWSLLWPFALGSVPLAFIGGAITLPGHWYKTLVGIVLLLSAGRLVWERAATATDTHRYRVPLALAILCGAAIGLLSGLTGTGGGIFLSPLLMFTRWAETRERGVSRRRSSS